MRWLLSPRARRPKPAQSDVRGSGLLGSNPLRAGIDDFLLNISFLTRVRCIILAWVETDRLCPSQFRKNLSISLLDTRNTMAGIFSFKCAQCGETHEGSPSFGFKAPDPWLQQPDEVKAKGEIGDDLCKYTDEDGEHYFARVVLLVPIHGVEEPFMWGVWVSLSKESFDHYVETWDKPDLDRGYFGWFCSALPYYENTWSLAADVHPQAGGDRPYLNLHETDHELYRDFSNGISIQKAQHIAELCLHG